MSKKETEKKSFLIYYDNEVIVCRLSDDEAGKLFKALFPYGKENIKPDFNNSPALAMAFDILSMAIDRDKEKYIKRCETNRKNINKRWNENNTTEYERIQTNTKDTDKDMDKDMDMDKDIKKKDTKVSKEKAKRFIPPTIEEVKAYCKEKAYNVDANRFVDFYESKGWMVGKNKMKDWKAAVRTWARKDMKVDIKLQNQERKVKQTGFSNFQERNYGNMSDLEKKMLGL